MEEVDAWMTTRGLPSKLQMQIRQHYQEVHSHQETCTNMHSTKALECELQTH